MNQSNQKSRTTQFEKRRKTNKMLSILMVSGVVLLIFLIGFWIFSDKDQEANQVKDPAENNEVMNEPLNDKTSNQGDEEVASENEVTETPEVADPQEDDGNQETGVDNDNEATENEADDIPITKPIEPSDNNVKIAYKGDWDPIGTEQTGPHTTTYAEGSMDRNEMEAAVKMVTGLDTMITWWLENGGEQKVIATVSDMQQIDVYRVYLSWIDQEGWQPTKVEELIENDKKKN